MRENHLWNRAKRVQINTSPEVVGGFDIGFDQRIPEKTRDVLMHFAYWVEDRFHLPVTLWVDFKYNHYLIAPDGKRVRHRFYWVDFANYPVFENPDDIPVIELPVRMEHCSVEGVLTAFIEAISRYDIWLLNEPVKEFVPNPQETEEVLRAYLEDAENGQGREDHYESDRS